MLRKWFKFWKKSVSKPKVIRVDKYVVVEAFKLDGITYYQYEDVFNMPTARAMAAITIFAEFDMRCTREYLKNHIAAVKKILQPENKRIDLLSLAALHSNLEARLDLMPFPDYIYKLASVMYFDEKESPYSYDWDYNKKKIDSWKAAGGALDFFCTVPLKNLMPYAMQQGASVQSYFDLLEEINATHLAAIQTVLSASK